MNVVYAYLNQPYPYPNRTWKTILAIALSIFTILLLFQPFGINNIIVEYRYWVILGYGLITALVLFFQIYISPQLYPSFFEDIDWTVKRNILNTSTTLVLIALGNFIYGYFLGITWQSLNITSLFFVLFITIAVGIIPIILITVFRQNRLLALSLKESKLLNESLSKNSKASGIEDSNTTLTLLGSGKNEKLEIHSKQLLFIEAYGNYIKVTYQVSNTTLQTMLRTTIKQMTLETEKHSEIVKCHRAFIVNTQAIKHILGNSQGYRLVLNGVDQEIPVSRSYTSIIKNAIESMQINHSSQI